MKPLMRFKYCVSKHWQFTICHDQGLIDLHFTRSEQNSPDLFIVVPRRTQADTDELIRRQHNSGFGRRSRRRRPTSEVRRTTTCGGVTREYRYQQSVLLGNLFQSRTTSARRLEQEPFCYTQILKPVNGLICFVNNFDVCILNPSTRERTPWIGSSLRRSKEYNFVKKNVRVVLWKPTYFFGFDPATKRHKVICTWRVLVQDGSKPKRLLDSIRQTNICEVLTVGDLRWRRIKAEVPFSYLVKSSVYANGFIYWGDKSTGIPEFLNSFVVGSEKFRATSVPKEIREKCMNPGKCYTANFSGLTEVGGKIALLQQWDLTVVKLWVCNNDASIGSYSSWTEMTLELPFQWDNSSISAFFHGVAGADRIIIESNPRKVKSGVVSKLVSGSLFSNLESVSLFASFAEIRLRLDVDVTSARDSAPAPAPIESFPGMSFHGYARPSSIQAQAMPVALRGRELLSCAQTGTKPSVRRGDYAPAGNRTRVCTVAGYYSTTRPLVL
ncbi:hypothetical protein MKW94_027802, partial [Papaver nudicaule]|nr:hypothetical protein [Papaver nudicaule]